MPWKTGQILWKMSDGKDLVKVGLTFHKQSTDRRIYKKMAESRRQRVASPALPAWRPAEQRPTPARRQPTPCMKKKVASPSSQTLQEPPTSIITHGRTQQKVTIETSLTIIWPTTPPPTPDSRLCRRAGSTLYRRVQILVNRWLSTTSTIFDSHTLCTRPTINLQHQDKCIQQRGCEGNSTPAPRWDYQRGSSMYDMKDKNWASSRGPSQRSTLISIATRSRRRATECDNISWYDFSEQACRDLEGIEYRKIQLHRYEDRRGRHRQHPLRLPIGEINMLLVNETYSRLELCT